MIIENYYNFILVLRYVLFVFDKNRKIGNMKKSVLKRNRDKKKKVQMSP